MQVCGWQTHWPFRQASNCIGHFPQSSDPPHALFGMPQMAMSFGHVVGVQSHFPKLHSPLLAHGPHSRIFPQPSSCVPQTKPRSMQDFGWHVIGAAASFNVAAPKSTPSNVEHPTAKTASTMAGRRRSIMSERMCEGCAER
jgi:hypothetical protein